MTRGETAVPFVLAGVACAQCVTKASKVMAASRRRAKYPEGILLSIQSSLRICAKIWDLFPFFVL